MIYHYTLITSLPRHRRQYKVKETPISRIQLEKRFKMINEEERYTLVQLEELVWKSWFDKESPLPATIARAKKLQALGNPFINDLINWYLDLRSLFTALRLRKTGESQTNLAEHLYGRLCTRLTNHWDHPEFDLQHVYPWLPELQKKFAANESAAVEDILLTQLWRHLDAIETQHYFDFEALIIYLLRWNIVDYWSQFNEKIAKERIIQLMNEAEDNKRDQGTAA